MAMLQTQLEKKLAIGCLISFILCIVFLVTTIVFATTKEKIIEEKHIETIVSDKNKTDETVETNGTETTIGTCETGICRTTRCGVTAYELKSSMDDTVEPCDNFYKFACGNFEKITDLESESEKGHASTAARELVREAKAILGKSNPTGCSSATCFAKFLYRQCFSQASTIEASRATIIRILRSHLSIWPILDVYDPPKDFDLFLTMASMIRSLGHSTPLQVNFKPNPLRSSAFVTSLSYDSLSSSNMKGIFSEGVHRSSHTTLLEQIRAVVNFFNPNAINRPYFLTDITSIADIIKEEAKLKIQKSTSYNESEYFFTIQSLNTLVPVVNWTQFFDIIFEKTGYKPTKDFRVASESINDFAKFSNYFYKLPKRQAANYLGWKLVSQWGQLFSQEIRNIVTPTVDCFTFTNNGMGFAVSKLFIDEQILFDETREEVTHIVEEVQKSFEKIVNESKWLDSSSKETAFRKIRNMAKIVGVPDWVRSNDEVNDYYKDLLQLLSVSRSFEDSFVFVRNNYFVKQAGQLKSKLNRDTYWPTDSPLETNAYHHYLTNAIYFPLGILEYPFYFSEIPRALNFGSLGYIAGHEVLHGFSAGIIYDEDGNLKLWLSNSSLLYFNESATCLKNQYSNIFDEIANMTLLANQTLFEDISDNGGIRTAFWAYKNNKNLQAGRLKGLEKYSEDQLFFISAAQPFCSKITPGGMKDKILTDDHSPNKYRAILPFQNLPEFSKAFNCPLNSYMNPEHKCKLW